jgi:transposase
MARLLMTDGDTLPKAEQSFVSRLLLQLPGLADSIAAAKRLNAVLRRDSKETLKQVLEDTARHWLGIVCCKPAAGPRRCAGGAQTAVDHEPAEGQINRLKMLKRTMYGRAGFQLLRARVPVMLHRSPAGSDLCWPE